MFAHSSLIGLRLLGGIIGIGLMGWAFARFRLHLIRRWEFSLTVLASSGLVAVAIHPNLINLIAAMLRLDNLQYGRLITLLLLSNFLLWLLHLSLRAKINIRDINFDLLVRQLALARHDTNRLKDSIEQITVIIPALNEARNLEHVLPRMPKKILDSKLGVLVIDDGSSDDTVEVTERLGFTAVSNPINRGGGASLRLGYDIAALGKAKIVVTMDADGQHLPEEIERLVLPILEKRADIVIGSRVKGTQEKDSAVRLAGIHIFNALINLLAGTRISDCSNGFRAFRVEALQQILLTHDQFHTAELIIEAARNNLRITEAPITVLRRHEGTSKKGRNLSYGVNFFKSIINAWFR